MQAWVELGDQIGVETGGQIVNGAGSKATKMVMQVAACVVPGAGPAGSRGQLGRHSDGDQGFECFINGRQTDPGNPRADGLIDVFGGGMFCRLAEMLVDGEPLRSAPQTGFLDDHPEILVIERQGFHRLSGSPARTYSKMTVTGWPLSSKRPGAAAIPSRHSPFHSWAA